MLRALFCLAALTFLCGRASFGAGTLDDVREEVREKEKEKDKKKKKKKKPKPDKTSDDTSKGDDDSDGGDGLDPETFEAVVQVLTQIVTAPFWLPHYALEDDFGRPGYFMPYPYARGARGHMIIGRRPQESLPAGLARRRALRICIEDSNDFEGVNRLSGRLLLSTSERFGLDGAVTYMTEGGAGDLVIGDANLVFRFAQSETAQFRTGLGVAFMSDEAGADSGFNFTYGADFFPGSPVVLSGSLDLGCLGEAFVFHWRLTAGAMLARSEIYAGYDFLSIGSVDIQGPVLGVRLWF